MPCVRCAISTLTLTSGSMRPTASPVKVDLHLWEVVCVWTPTRSTRSSRGQRNLFDDTLVYDTLTGSGRSTTAEPCWGDRVRVESHTSRVLSSGYPEVGESLYRAGPKPPRPRRHWRGPPEGRESHARPLGRFFTRNSGVSDSRRRGPSLRSRVKVCERKDEVRDVQEVGESGLKSATLPPLGFLPALIFPQ